MQADFKEELSSIVSQELLAHFGSQLPSETMSAVHALLMKTMFHTFDETSSMDAEPRMKKIASACDTKFLEIFTAPGRDISALAALPAFHATTSSRATETLVRLRAEYLGGARGTAPASKLLNKTLPMYEFVRNTLGIRMHGSENQNLFANGLGVEDVTIGQNVSIIYEAIRDGRLQGIVVDMLS